MSLSSTCGMFPRLSQGDMDCLSTRVDCAKIKAAIFNMGALKALKPNGLNPLFFQSQWETMKDIIFDLVKEEFNDHARIKKLNNIMIVLIPKIDNPCVIHDFRPISIFNVSYKIVQRSSRAD